MKNLKIITTILFCLVAFSCKKDKSPTKNNTVAYVLGPKTVIIDTPTALIISYVDSSKVVFDGTSKQLENLVVGNIIISGIAPNAPYGFFGRITSIQKSGTVYIISITETSLEEAFKELHLDYTKYFTTDDTAGRVSGNAFSFEFPNTILHDGDGNNSTVSDQIKLALKFTLKPSFRFAVDINSFKLTYAITEGDFQTTFTQSITAGGNVGTINKKINLFQEQLVPFSIPGLPFLVVVPYLRVSLGTKATINVSVSASQDITSEIKANIEYKNNTWNTNFVKSMQPTFIFSGVNGKIDARFYLEPAIDYKLYKSDWAKGSISTQAYLNLSAALLPDPNCELKAGIKAGAEAKLKFFGINFSAALYPEIFDFNTVLFTCTYKPQSKFIANNTTAFIGDEVQFTDSSTNAPTTWKWTFEGGSPLTSNIQNPRVSYFTSGDYDVTLIATNADGSDTLKKTEYIHVTQNLNDTLKYCRTENTSTICFTSPIGGNGAGCAINTCKTNYSGYSIDIYIINGNPVSGLVKAGSFTGVTSTYTAVACPPPTVPPTPIGDVSPCPPCGTGSPSNQVTFTGNNFSSSDGSITGYIDGNTVYIILSGTTYLMSRC